jgi:hypothetical protein
MLRLAPVAVLLALLLAVFPAHALRAAPLSPDSNSALADTLTIAGDVNCSGGVDIADALQIIRLYAGLSTNASCMSAAGNTDCDSDKDPVDSLRILRYLGGLSNTAPPGCTPIGDPMGAPTSSFDKIGAALTAGTISSETALLYNVYATFGDDALPPEFRGDDSDGTPDSGGVAITQSMLSTVSPETRALLAPFLIPPIYGASWFGSHTAAANAVPERVLGACPGASQGWVCRDAASAGVRVWWQTRYPGDAAQAQAIANAMDSTIWPALTGLMGQPLSDAGTTYDGGSPSVDIYLLDLARSVAPDHSQPGCKKTPAYINLQRGVSLSVVAHEFMHVLQWGFDVSQGCMYQTGGGEYNWLAEATATWAEDYVFPQANDEQYLSDFFMAEPGKPLETANDKHEYGAYIFFLYLTKFYDSNQIVRTIWNNTAQYGSLKAVEQALPGGFEERWAPFAACLWNKAPSDCFAKWDGVQQAAADAVAPEEFGMGAATISRSLELTANVEHMATSYRRFVFTDDRVHSVVFNNTLAGVPHAAVQALAKINGQWHGPLDWTGRATNVFCRDIAAQHIEELVIIISNSDWETKGKLQPASPPTLTAYTSGCPDFVGTASVVEHDGSIVLTVNVSGLRFQYIKTEGPLVRYELTESPVVTVRASGGTGGCTWSGEMTLQPADGTDATGKVQGNLVVNLDTHTYGGEIFGFDPNAVPMSYTCPDYPPSAMDWFPVWIMDTGLPTEVEITDDGRLDGVQITNVVSFYGRWEWHFDPAPPE